MQGRLLGCLAAIAVAAAAGPTAAAEAYALGDWTLIERKDPVTDKSSFSARLVSGEDRFEVECSPDRQLLVGFSPERFLGSYSRGRRDVTFRFDDAAPQTEDNWLFTDRTVLKGANVGRFLAQLGAAHRLVIRTMTYRYETVTSEFSTEGAAKVVAGLYAVCGGKPG